MNDLQEKLLIMMKWLHDFISSHHLKYYICGGTLLGAIRHKGFIPWDDDIDIFMPRDDYEQLCELLKDPIEHYVIETLDSNNKDFLYTFAKFYDTNTTMVETLKKNIKRGVYIDIFPLDGLGNTFEEAKKYYKAIDKKNMFLTTRLCKYRKGRKWYKNMLVFLCRAIPPIFVNDRSLCKKINELNKKRRFDDYQFFGVNMSAYRFRAIYNKELLGTPTDYTFEGITLWGPQNYDEYLTHTYGKWRELPPENKRKSTHSFISLDLKKSYLNDK